MSKRSAATVGSKPTAANAVTAATSGGDERLAHRLRAR